MADSTLKIKLNTIYQEKQNKILPENIKSGVTIFDIEGTLEEGSGLDTSDATATTQDIINGKTAYVNDEKLTGTLAIKTSTDTASNIYSTNYTSANSLTFEGEWASKYNRTAFDPGAKFNLIVNESEIAEKISLTADKIVSGNTVLGVEGTAEAGGSQYEEIKLSELQVGDSIIGIRVTGKPTEVTDESLPVFEEVQGEMNGLIWTSMYSDGEDSNRLYFMCSGMLGGTNYGGGSVLFKRVGTTWTALNDMEIYVLTSPMPIGYINPTDIPKLDNCISVIKVK